MITSIIKEINQLPSDTPESVGSTSKPLNHYCEITLLNGTKGIHFSTDADEINSIRVGSIISYINVQIHKDKNFFNGFTKTKVNSEERRQLSIVMQSSVSRASEILALTNVKFKDSDAAYEGVTNLAAKIFNLLNVE